MDKNKHAVEGKLSVLDKGYVRIPEGGVLGDDTTVVNAARVSFNKHTDKLKEKDKGLINYLIRNNETSPFRHAMLQFEIYAPLMVARQWWKYIVGSDHRDPFTGWNESSRRYITEEPTFYIPEEDQWRSKPDNNKQGSGEPLSEHRGQKFTEALKTMIENGETWYNVALEAGIAPEQARLFLPAYGMYVRWYWTASLEGVCHFLNQRMDSHAQYEIRQYANKVYELAENRFPYVISKMVDRSDGE